jgi:DNA-binding XRE family transcriptional regulator
MRASARSLSNERVSAELTQHQLGERLGVAASSISNWECQQNVPSVFGWLTWIEALGCRVQVVREDDSIVAEFGG